MDPSRARTHPVAVLTPVLLVVLLLALGARDASARPPLRRAFFNVYTAAVGSRLDNLPSHAGHCGVCHYDFNGGGARNPYGVALELALPAHDTAEQAVQSIAGQDSDGDGYTNLAEITDLLTYSNTPTFPGLTPGNVGNAVNVPNLNEITPFLVPTTGVDTEPPMVTVLSPNGAESWTGGTAHPITWSATDNVGVNAVDVYFRETEAGPWQPLALNLANTGAFTWFVQNVPGGTNRVRVVARDAAGLSGSDQSNNLFTIVRTPGGIAPTTLRDFKQGGTQPLGGGTFQTSAACITCHGGYNPATEPGHAAMGSMMMQAARDPLFLAALAIAEQDAPSSGDLCLRCHSPFGWLGGRSTPTGGEQLNAADRDGVACDFCHRSVDPFYKPGVSPPEDQPVLAALLLPAHSYSNGQYVVDPDQRKRGPYTDPVAPHAFLASSFLRSSEFCGTCHDVSNPVFARVAGDDYAPNAFDAPAESLLSHRLMPLERTYSEWRHSAFPAGVFAPEFAGNKPDGIVATCQDCHMPDVSGKGCNDPGAPTRADLPFHDLSGGNAWLGPIINTQFPGETDAGALADGAARAASMLARAADVDLAAQSEGDSFRVHVTITNHTGHKLPTGYPEGRRMWLEVIAKDALGQTIFRSGAYDAATGVLTHDAQAVVYEAELGISPGLAAILGQTGGKSFHFALNDSVYKDNRIPPLGFTNTAFASFGGNPVESGHAVPRYADGQNWDLSSFALPPASRSAVVRLWYQTTSREYVEFLRDRNTTNAAGQTMYDLWTANGRAAPVLMETDSITFAPVAIGDGGPPALALRAVRNPFRGQLDLSLDVVRRAPVALEIYDARGRRFLRREYGVLPAGTHALAWSDRRAGPGVYWVRVTVGGKALVRQIVRLE